jgi:Outer membrane protein beta-barrel family/Carboxypeptidase regulatory-like domain
MKKTIQSTFLTLLVMFLSNQSVFAQAQIIGTIADKSGKSLPFANVLLLNAKDSSFVKGGIAKDDGAFEIQNVSVGAYLCQISMVGFANTYSTVFQLTPQYLTHDLGKMVVTEAAELKTMEVVAKRPFLEQKIDRMVVNVANSITSAGGNALEVLQRAPGVQVNRQTKTISLVGKQGVVVMINGKISQMPSDAVVQMLEGMNADNIDRIELIHTPPANFEAEGNAGIINIVLRSTGDVGLNGGYAVGVGYGRGEKYNGSVYFNSRSKYVNLFGSYGYNMNNSPQAFTNYRGVNQGGNFNETETSSDRYATPTGVQDARLGADFQVSKNTVIGVLGGFMDRNWDMKATNATKYSKNGNLQSQLLMPNTEINHAQTFSGNVNLMHRLTKTQTLNVDADIIYINRNNPSNYDIKTLDANNKETPQYALRIGNRTPINVKVAKVDYVNDVNKNVKLEMGAKITSVRFDNDVRVDSASPQKDWVLLSDYTSLNHLNESVFGAYTTISAKINAKTDIKAGVRFEDTRTNLGSEKQPNIVDRHYGSWFPSVFINRQIAEKQSLNLSYSRRITRPQLQWLAPYLIFADPTTLQGGNVALQPSFTDAIKLNYTLKTWSIGISYSIQDQPMRWIPNVDTKTNRQISRPQNLDKERVLGANLNVPLHPTKWWDMQNNVYVNSTETDFKIADKPLTVQNVNYGFNTTNAFTLPRKWSIEISARYDSPGYWGVMKWEANWAANIGIQKNFGEKWGKLRFNVNDIFQTSSWFGVVNQPEVNLFVKESYQVAERVFMLSWSNKFGNNKLKSERKRQTGAAEEKERL